MLQFQLTNGSVLQPVNPNVEKSLASRNPMSTPILEIPWSQVDQMEGLRSTNTKVTALSLYPLDTSFIHY